jgi:hypothetical protein
MAEPPYVRAAHLALFSFVLTFVASRTVVFLIMAGRIPNLFLFLHGTHIHHLNYGIFLLAAVAGYLLFKRPIGRAADMAALAYGFAMALTFDEFGMWLHLGGSYWQRASIDAVVILAALLALLAFAPSLKNLESRHFWGFLILIVASLLFGVVLFESGQRIGHLVGPKLEALELSSTP